jgi:hypothetical protein
MVITRRRGADGQLMFLTGFAGRGDGDVIMPGRIVAICTSLPYPIAARNCPPKAGFHATSDRP